MKKMYLILALGLLNSFAHASQQNQPKQTKPTSVKLTPQTVYYNACMANLNAAVGKALQEKACMTPPVGANVNCNKNDSVVTTSSEITPNDLHVYCSALTGIVPQKNALPLELDDKTPVTSRLKALDMLGKAVDYLEQGFIPQNVVSVVTKAPLK